MINCILKEEKILGRISGSKIFCPTHHPWDSRAPSAAAESARLTRPDILSAPLPRTRSGSVYAPRAHKRSQRIPTATPHSHSHTLLPHLRKLPRGPRCVSPPVTDHNQTLGPAWPGPTPHTARTPSLAPARLHAHITDPRTGKHAHAITLLQTGTAPA